MPSAIGNFFMKSIVNSPLHPLLGGGIAVISVQGCKTGKHYSTPVNVVKDDGVFTVVSLKNRHWWRNLRGGRPAELRLSGVNYSVHGEVLESHEEVVEGLGRYFERHPAYAKYFGVNISPGGQPAPEDLEREARLRVIVHLKRRQDNPEEGIAR
jgi:hypothetical protein